MLIEQIIEFKLRGPGPLRFKINYTFTRTCSPTTGCVYEKKSLRKIFDLIIICC